MLRGFGVGAGDFLVDLPGEIVQFAAGHAQGFGVVAQHAFGRAFDALFQVFNVLAGALLELSGFVYQIPL